MASGRLLIPGWMPALDEDGNPIPNARVFFYLNKTTTLAAVFSDEAMTVPLANPVPSNASGRFPAVWADDSVLYSASVDAPYGPAGIPFTYDDLSASMAADILVAGAAEAAADEAQQTLVEIQNVIDAAMQAGGGEAAVAGAIAGANAAQAVVATKLDKLSSLAEVPGLGSLSGQVSVQYRALPGDGYAGTFQWVPGNQSSGVSSDPLQGVWVAPASAPTGASGAWKRVFDGPVRAEWFGARADYNEVIPGLSTDNSDAINAALEVANDVILSRGLYRISKTIRVKPYQRLFSPSGSFRVTVGDADAFADLTMGTVIVPWQMDKEHALEAMVTARERNGGVINNPQAAEAYTAASAGRLAKYSLISFTNGDAAGATRATMRNFSIAIKQSRGSSISGITIRCPDSTGSLYGSASTQTLGDNCDVGLMGWNAFGASADSVDVSGFFRIAGCLVIPTRDPDDAAYFPQTDLYHLSNVYLEGWRSLAIRSYDRVPVKSVSSTQIVVSWWKEHCFNPTGSIRVNSTDYTYSSLTYNAGAQELVFGGLSADPVAGGVTAGAPLSRTEDSANFGSGGFYMSGRNFIRSWTHRSLRPSTDGWFTDPLPSSAALLEISGQPLRGIQISNTYFHGREDIAWFLVDIGDVYFVNCYHEAKSLASGYGAPVSRFIGLSNAEMTARSVALGIPEPMGQASNIHLVGWSQTESGTDMRPIWRTSISYGRFGSGSTFDDGLWCPTYSTNDAYDRNNSTTSTVFSSRVPAVRGSVHPYQVLSATNTARMSIDQGGRIGFGFGFSTTADHPYAGNLFFGANSIFNVENTSNTNASGYRTANTAGIARFSVDSSGNAEIQTGNIQRFRISASRVYIRPAVVPTYANDAAAIAAGLVSGECYKTTVSGVTYLATLP